MVRNSFHWDTKVLVRIPDGSIPFISVNWVFCILSGNTPHVSHRNVHKAMRKSPIV